MTSFVTESTRRSVRPGVYPIRDFTLRNTSIEAERRTVCAPCVSLSLTRRNLDFDAERSLWPLGRVIVVLMPAMVHLACFIYKSCTGISIDTPELGRPEQPDP